MEKYGKIHHFSWVNHGKSTISMAIFNSYVRHNQRVNLHFPMVFPWFLQVDHRHPLHEAMPTELHRAALRPSLRASTHRPLAAVVFFPRKNGGFNGKTIGKP